MASATFKSTDENSGMPQQVNSNEPSVFFTLPPELRIAIYDYLLVRDAHSAQEPRHPQILLTSQELHDEAMVEMEKKKNHVLFHIQSAGNALSLTIGTSLVFQQPADEVVSAFAILKNLPSGLDNIKRVILRFSVVKPHHPFRADQLSKQIKHIMRALASALNPTEAVSLSIDTSAMLQGGYRQKKVDKLLRYLGKLRPLVTSSSPGRTHVLKRSNPVYDIIKDCSERYKEAVNVVGLLKRTGLKPNGTPAIEKYIEAFDKGLKNADHVDMWLETKILMKCVPTELLMIENVLRSPQMRNLKRQAEAILKEEKMLENKS